MKVRLLLQVLLFVTVLSLFLIFDFPFLLVLPAFLLALRCPFGWSCRAHWVGNFGSGGHFRTGNLQCFPIPVAINALGSSGARIAILVSLAIHSFGTSSGWTSVTFAIYALCSSSKWLSFLSPVAIYAFCSSGRRTSVPFAVRSFCSSGRWLSFLFPMAINAFCSSSRPS